MLEQRPAHTAQTRARVPQQSLSQCSFAFFRLNKRRAVRSFVTVAGSAYTVASDVEGFPYSCRPRSLNRRVLFCSLLCASVVAPGSSAATVEAQELQVGQGKQFSTITDAIGAASPGTLIRVGPGRYNERLTIEKTVTLVGDPDNPAAVELNWETLQPYQPTIFCTSNNVVIRGFAIRHKSPSIANNYAVQLQDCNAALDSCDISSASGNGIGSEGGSPQVYSCFIHDCASNGIAIFGGQEGSRASAVVENCDLQRNKGHGILIRDGATPAITDSFIFRNGGYGMMLQDCGGSYSRNIVKENFEGSVGHLLLFEGFDINEVVAGNKLDKYPQKLTPLRR